jgi:hypothetical protein
MMWLCLLTWSFTFLIDEDLEFLPAEPLLRTPNSEIRLTPVAEVLLEADLDCLRLLWLL